MEPTRIDVKQLRRRLGWFAVIYVVSVSVVIAVAYGLKAIIAQTG